MFYRAIKVKCFISANGSIESPQTAHYFHHQNGRPRCESHEKTVNLETLWKWNKINYFNVLMDIPMNGRN